MNTFSVIANAYIPSMTNSARNVPDQSLPMVDRTLIHFVTALASVLTVTQMSGQPFLAKYKHVRIHTEPHAPTTSSSCFFN